MKKNSWLVVLMLMVTVPAMAADFKTNVPSCADARSGQSMATVPAFVAQLNASTLASPSTGGSMSGAPGNGAGIGAMCEWFDIECSDGSTDECCGNVDSCLGYCEDVCGGPCEYRDQ